MSILSGYKKFKKYIKTSSGFQLQSLWSNANTVEADDGKNMETKELRVLLRQTVQILPQARIL